MMPGSHVGRSTVIRMARLAAGRLFWHCGAHTAEPKVGLILIPKSLCFCGRGARITLSRGAQRASRGVVHGMVHARAWPL